MTGVAPVARTSIIAGAVSAMSNYVGERKFVKTAGINMKKLDATCSKYISDLRLASGLTLLGYCFAPG
jgi:hypothetical protein